MIDDKFIRRAIGLDVSALADAERVKDAYISFFDTPDGEIIMEDLAVRCQMFGTSFVAGDPQATAYNEGQRNIFCYILGMSLKKYSEKRQTEAKT